MNVITLVSDSSVERLSALTGKLGKLPGVQVRSLMAKPPPKELPTMIHPTHDGLTDFIPAARIEELLRRPPAQADEVHEMLAKSLAKQRLSLEQMAALLSVTDAGASGGDVRRRARAQRRRSTAIASCSSRRCT